MNNVGKLIPLSRIFLISVVLFSCSQGWVSFTSETGNFIIEMPSRPFEEIRHLSTDAGIVDLHMYTAEDPPISYMVSYNDYPLPYLQQTNLSEFFDGARDGAIDNVHGRLLSESHIEMDGYPGREIEVELAGGKAILRLKCFLVGNRFYQLSSTTAPDDAFNKNVSRFYDSFELLEKSDLPLLPKLLGDLGYEYETDEYGNYYFTLAYDDGRSQLVYVTETSGSIYPHPVYLVWSPVSSFTDRLKSDQANLLLRKNAEVEVGSFQIHRYQDSNSLIFAAQITSPLQTEVLQKYILKIASTADDLEKQLTGDDKF